MKEPKFKISKEKKEELKGFIKDFFKKEREEEIGDLAADIFLDFVIEKLGPEFYNQGVNDSNRFIEEKLNDLFELNK